MEYTLEQLAEDCRAALRAQDTMAARRTIQACCSRACNDDGFVAAHFGPDNTSERKIIYEDPELGFCILSHVREEFQPQPCARSRPELGDLRAG